MARLTIVPSEGDLATGASHKLEIIVHALLCSVSDYEVILWELL